MNKNMVIKTGAVVLLLIFGVYGGYSFFQANNEIKQHGYVRGHIVRNRSLIASRNSLGVYDIVKRISPSWADGMAELHTHLTYNDAVRHEMILDSLEGINDAHFRYYQDTITEIKSLLYIHYKSQDERKPIDEKATKAQQSLESYKRAIFDAIFEYGHTNLFKGKGAFAIAQGHLAMLNIGISELENTLSKVDGGRYARNRYIEPYLGIWKCVKSSTGDVGITMEIQRDQVLYRSSYNNTLVAKDADIYIVRDGAKASFRFKSAARGTEYMNASLSQDGSSMVVRNEAMKMTWEYVRINN